MCMMNYEDDVNEIVSDPNVNGNDLKIIPKEKPAKHDDDSLKISKLIEVSNKPGKSTRENEKCNPNPENQFDMTEIITSTISENKMINNVDVSTVSSVTKTNLHEQIITSENVDLNDNFEKKEKEIKQKEKDLKKWQNDLKKQTSNLSEVSSQLGAARILISKLEYELEHERKKFKPSKEEIVIPLRNINCNATVQTPVQQTQTIPINEQKEDPQPIHPYQTISQQSQSPVPTSGPLPTQQEQQKIPGPPPINPFSSHLPYIGPPPMYPHPSHSPHMVPPPMYPYQMPPPPGHQHYPYHAPPPAYQFHHMYMTPSTPFPSYNQHMGPQMNISQQNRHPWCSDLRNGHPCAFHCHCPCSNTCGNLRKDQTTEKNDYTALILKNQQLQIEMIHNQNEMILQKLNEVKTQGHIQARQLKKHSESNKTDLQDSQTQPIHKEPNKEIPSKSSKIEVIQSSNTKDKEIKCDMKIIKVTRNKLKTCPDNKLQKIDILSSSNKNKDFSHSITFVNDHTTESLTPTENMEEKGNGNPSKSTSSVPFLELLKPQKLKE